MARNVSSPENLGVPDPEFARASLNWKNLPRQEGELRKGIVLAGVCDTGVSNSISPILNEFVRRNWTVFSMAKGPGDEILRSEHGFNRSGDFDPIERIERMRGRVVITGFSAIPSIEAIMNHAAHQKDMLVVGVEDYPGAYVHDFKDLFAREPMVRPDLLSVGNEWAKLVNIQEGYPVDQIIVPGFTALDATADVDRPKTRKEVREHLGIAEDRLVIGWFGQIGGATVEHLQVFLKGLRALELQNYALLVRLHPYDDNPKSVYDGLFEPIKDRVVYAGRDVERRAERVIAAVDLGINERSTTALTGASLGIPFISIAVPEINERHKLMLGLRVGVIEDGTSPLVENPVNMAGTLDRVLNDNSYREDIFRSMKNWQSDGKAASRAADAIESMVAR